MNGKNIVYYSIWRLNGHKDADCGYELDMTVTQPDRDDEMEV